MKKLKLQGSWEMKTCLYKPIGAQKSSSCDFSDECIGYYDQLFLMFIKKSQKVLFFTLKKCTIKIKHKTLMHVIICLKQKILKMVF